MDMKKPRTIDFKTLGEYSPITTESLEINTKFTILNFKTLAEYSPIAT